MVNPHVHYRYLLSLPERALRSLGALSGGLLKEVGEVEGVYISGNNLAENFILQRTASHGIELLGILTFRASPVWVLAALADATGAGNKLIREISQALIEEGLLQSDAQFETMEQMLDGLEKTTSHLALTLNLPPVDIASLRREWETFRQEVKTIPPK